MAKKRVCVIKGDGIGPEVIDACLTVIKHLKLDELEFIEAYAGMGCYETFGDYLPRETIAKLASADAGLLGAISSPPINNDADYIPVIPTLRKKFELFANLRPFNSTYNPKVGATKTTANERKILDIVLIRENLEDVYLAPEKVMIVERSGGGNNTTTRDNTTTNNNLEVITYRKITASGCKRICKFAIDFAIQQHRKKITCIHKANVLRKSDGLFRNVFFKLAEDWVKYNNNQYKLQFDECYVDTAALQSVIEPEKFDVIVTLNLYGDILSDLLAGVCYGTLGSAPSGNFGENFAIFEPVHGTAPKLAGKNLANPTATILAGAMLLDYLDYQVEAELVRKAVATTIQVDGIRTIDLGGDATTTEFTSAVVKSLQLRFRSNV